ncbi:MAG: hypothetical protein HIU81_12285 [Acidobacteria bacterium]|nr:hypothetical protein [Acidobacteriota bacterium]
MNSTAEPSVVAALSEAFAAERARLVGMLIRRTGDRELAEDCVQEAGTKALREWQHTGIPSTPRRGPWKDA